ncbi:MAG: type II toxin-antitoxin system YafQ family toxin [Bacteroidaceae bacterium]|nr:type II toxin-antitoxin system YafQ family toxin [Bacteroidaceae bacterium]MBR4648944.1 type II toxin-antitoxin system YafQ family toxin [Bacteroidaceae bacterium]
MYSISTTKRFDKDLKRCLKRGLRMELIFDAIQLLQATGTLPAKYHPHKLSGNKQGQWECHIQPNWLMTWEQNDTQLMLLFLQTGTHSDIFKK